MFRNIAILSTLVTCVVFTSLALQGTKLSAVYPLMWAIITLIYQLSEPK
jgi:hypothetical protein